MTFKPNDHSEAQLTKPEIAQAIHVDLKESRDFFAAQKTVDKSLTTDPHTLHFDTASIYGDSNGAKTIDSRSPVSEANPNNGQGLFIGSQSDFDRLNTIKAADPRNDVLSRAEITQGALSELIASNTNGNNKVDREEWLKIAGRFGYNSEGANRAYDLGSAMANQGISLSEITDRIITPGYIAADTNNNGIDRNEFKRLIGNNTDNPPQPEHNDTTGKITDGSDLYGLFKLDAGVSQGDVDQVKTALKDVPEPVRQAIRDYKPEIIITPNMPVEGAAAYWDAANNQVVIGAGTGLVKEAAAHEFWHVADTRWGITAEAGFKEAAARDLANGALSKLGPYASVLADDPIVSGTPVGDAFAEVGVDIDRFYGGTDAQTNIAPLMGRAFANTETWLRQWTNSHLA